MGGSSGYTLPEGFDPVAEGFTPPVGVQRRQVVAPPEGYRPGIDPEWNYFGSTLNPPADPTGPIVDPIFTYPGIGPTFPPGWNPFDEDFSIDGEGFNFEGIFPEYSSPEIDYDLLAGAIDMPTFQMPDYTDLNQQLLALQGGLGGLEAQFENFQMPSYEIPDLDYDLLASNLAGNINMPSFEMPDYTQQFENIQAGLGGLGSQIGNMPSFEMPDYSQDFLNLGTTLGGLGTQLGNLQMPTFEMPEFDYDLLAGNIAGNINMPTFEMPDYTQQFENLQTGLGGLGTQIGNMPSFDMPDYTQLFQDLQGSVGGLGEQIGGLQMPSFEMPDYTQQFADIQSGLGGLGTQLGNMPSFQMPDYNQQFQNLQDQIGGLSYGGPSLEDIQGIMPTYQMPDYSQDLSAIMGGLNALQPQQYVPENPYGTSGFGFAKGGKIPRYQEGEGIAGLTRELGGTGGEEAMMTEGNEQLIQATVQAVLGMLPDQQTADAIINQFIGLYGQEAFMALREQVLQSQAPGAQTEGMIEGFGGGMDDFVQGVAGSQERIAASPGEYIVPADVVSQLGDGNSTEGSRKLDGMSERVRMAKTGTIEQAPPIDSEDVLPV